ETPSELNLLEEPSSLSLTAADSGSGSAIGISPIDDMKAEDFPHELPAAPKSGGIQSDFTSEIDLVPADEEEPKKPAARPAPAPATEVPDFGLSGSSIISLEPG